MERACTGGVKQHAWKGKRTSALQLLEGLRIGIERPGGAGEPGKGIASQRTRSGEKGSQRRSHGKLQRGALMGGGTFPLICSSPVGKGNLNLDRKNQEKSPREGRCGPKEEGHCRTGEASGE